MNNMNRVFILGSGKSILSLSTKEIDIINSSNNIIAMNKYMAFYELSDIRPNAIYFHDIYGVNVFSYIVQKCNKQQLSNITWFLHPYLSMFLYTKKKQLCMNILKDFYYRLMALIKIILKLNRNCRLHRYVLFRKFHYFKIPSTHRIINVEIGDWLKGGKWADSFNDKLFHFRGSLTTCINVASIISPNSDIILVGNDFNGSEYFYEEELKRSGLIFEDYTTKIVKNAGVHYSFIKVKGTSMEEKFPFIQKELSKRGCHLYCTNPNSLLVTKAGVKYLDLNKL